MEDSLVFCDDLERWDGGGVWDGGQRGRERMYTDSWCTLWFSKNCTIHSRNLAWKILWTEEPGGLQSMVLQRVGCDWVTKQQYQQLQKRTQHCKAIVLQLKNKYTQFLKLNCKFGEIVKKCLHWPSRFDFDDFIYIAGLWPSMPSALCLPTPFIFMPHNSFHCHLFNFLLSGQTCHLLASLNPHKIP